MRNSDQWAVGSGQFSMNPVAFEIAVSGSFPGA